MSKRPIEVKCHHCGRDDREMRPYGPGGAMVCHPCATAPERVAETRAVYRAALESAQKHTDAAQLTPMGPVPYVIGRRR